MLFIRWLFRLDPYEIVLLWRAIGFAGAQNMTQCAPVYLLHCYIFERVFIFARKRKFLLIDRSFRNMVNGDKLGNVIENPQNKTFVVALYLRHMLSEIATGFGFCCGFRETASVGDAHVWRMR